MSQPFQKRIDPLYSPFFFTLSLRHSSWFLTLLILVIYFLQPNLMLIQFVFHTTPSYCLNWSFPYCTAPSLPPNTGISFTTVISLHLATFIPSETNVQLLERAQNLHDHILFFNLHFGCNFFLSHHNNIFFHIQKQISWFIPWSCFFFSYSVSTLLICNSFLTFWKHSLIS